MLKVKESFKASPLAKGLTYGVIAVSCFFVHAVLGLFVLIGAIAAYEFIEDQNIHQKTGKNYFYLAVFVFGALAFANYVVTNLAI